MTHVRDTFLRYLRDNISSSINIHAVRNDKNNPSQVDQRLNAINVEFLGLDMQWAGMQQVSIDVMFDDELECESVVYQLWDLFKSSFYIPLRDYSNPSSPVLIPQRSLYFEKMYFRKLPRTEYAHYSAIIELRFVNT